MNRPLGPPRPAAGLALKFMLTLALPGCAASAPPPRAHQMPSALPHGQSLVEVDVRNLAGFTVQFDSVLVAVDELPALALALPIDTNRPAPPLAFPVGPGEHQVTVRGAFRRCASVGCNAAWVLYREARYAVRVPERCVSAVRADVYEPPDPTGWHESSGWRTPNGGVRIPPQIDFAARTYCAPR